MRNINTRLLAIGAASLISALPMTSVSAKEPLGKCIGANSCKGQSACATANSSCAGQNTCKGRGWVKTTKKDCAKKGGEFSQ